MSYSVSLVPAAHRQLRKFDPQTRLRIEGVLMRLGENPRPPAAKRLVGGADRWSVRTGVYRIIYTVDDGELLVLVLSMGHRREIYR